MSDDEHIIGELDEKKIINIPAEELIIDDTDIIDPIDPPIPDDSDDSIDGGELGDMDIVMQTLDPYEEYDPNAR